MNIHQRLFNEIFRNEAEEVIHGRSMIDDDNFVFRNTNLKIKQYLGREFQKTYPGMYSTSLGPAYGVEYKINWGNKNRDVIELLILIENSSVLDAQKLLNILYEKKFWHGGHLGYDHIKFAEQGTYKKSGYKHEIPYSSDNLLQHIKDGNMSHKGTHIIHKLAKKSLDYIEIFNDEILQIMYNTPMGCTHILDLKYKRTHPTKFVNQQLENCESDSQKCIHCLRQFCSNHFNKKLKDESNICYQCEGKGVWCYSCFCPILTKENEFMKYCGCTEEGNRYHEKSKGNQQVFRDDYYR